MADGRDAGGHVPGRVPHPVHEQGVVGPQQLLVRHGPVQERRHSDRAALEHLRGDLEREVQGGGAPAQRDVRGRGAGHGLLAGERSRPLEVGPVGLEAGAHRRGPTGPVPLGVDLVPHHRERGRDAGLVEGGQHVRHEVGAPVVGELARVHETHRAVGGRFGAFGRSEPVRHHRREQLGAPGGGRDHRLEHGAGLGRLGQHQTARRGDATELLDAPGREAVLHVAVLGHVGPQPPREGAAVGELETGMDAAHEHHVVPGLLVPAGQHVRGAGGVHAPLPGRRLGGEHAHPRQGAQRSGEQVPAFDGLELDVHARTRAGEGLRQGGQPRGGAVDDVQVDVAVEQDAHAGGVGQAVGVVRVHALSSGQAARTSAIPWGASPGSSVKCNGVRSAPASTTMTSPACSRARAPSRCR